MTRGDPPMPDDALVDWVEYWDEHFRAYLVGGEFIDGPRRHRYAKPPFQIRASGLGSGTGKPEEMYRSMLFPVRNLLDAEIKTKSQLQVMIRNTAWTQYLAIRNTGFDKVAPGTIAQMTSAEAVAAVRAVTEYQPAVFQGIMQHGAEISASIEEGTYPQVVKGIKAKGIASGYGQNSLVAQAKVRFGPVAVSLQTLLSEFFSDFARCVENVVGEVVPVWSPYAKDVDAKIDPKDIAGYYYNVVTVNPLVPGESAVALQEGEHLLNLGAIDMGTFSQRYGAIENPGEMRKLVMRDKIMNSPEFQRIAIVEAAVETGVLDRAIDIALKYELDPLPFFQVLGLGVPGQQQMPNTPGPANPAQQASQNQLGGAPDATMKAQPEPFGVPPGPQAQARNAAAPGLSISG